jgi:heme a synthase
MANDVALVNVAPTLSLLSSVAVVATILLLVVAWRQRRKGHAAWLSALTTLTLVLTFDLIVFGSFTRLTDSGLGCPDWPGCYGSATPLGAAKEIAQAQSAMPTGPVTFTKAWIEMIHRYLAMTVGALILVVAVASWRQRPDLPFSPALPLFTLVWVLVQGLFGKYTVTLKLYPAIVCLHLLGGMFLLALLTVQQTRWKPSVMPIGPRTRMILVAAIAALWIQIALGGWVSTNYAVLACTGFPQCNGQWWPDMRWAEGFEFLRPLGHRSGGQLLSFDALVAIHMTHRLFALVLLGLLGCLAWRLWREPGQSNRRAAIAIAALAAWQVLSGLSNVVLGWPLIAALAHSAGAAALVGVTTAIWSKTRQASGQPGLAVVWPRSAGHLEFPR